MNLRVTLTRRGTRHGRFTLPAGEPGLPADAAARWQRCQPIVWRGAIATRLLRWRQEVRRTLALFARLRAGASFEAAVYRRMRGTRGFVPAGTTVDAADPREIAKVWTHRVVGTRIVGRDLWTKLAWIAHDERDPSLRIRFSWGSEMLTEWHSDPRRCRRVDEFACALFPECEVLAGHGPLLRTLGRLAGGKVRLSERILYNNCPGGGAVFHHDAETTQRGVCFGQFAGTTAWLALPRAELAAHVAAALRTSLRRADRALANPDAPKLYKLLNHDPRFTRRLAAAGALFVLQPGDVVLLPTVPGRDTCWHSVFGLGRRPSLAHSYGVFLR